MNPKFNVYGTTLIVLAEWKPTEVRNFKLHPCTVESLNLTAFLGTILTGRDYVRQYKRHQSHYGCAQTEPTVVCGFQNSPQQPAK
jgi:hypothetical protein